MVQPTSAADHASLAKEQAALRRVAVLVASNAPPDSVFSAVAREVAEVFQVDLATVCRFEREGIVVLSSFGLPAFPAGSYWPLDVPSLTRTIHETGRPARIDDFGDAQGLDALARVAGVTAAVGAPILVGGSVFGSINLAATEGGPFPADAGASTGGVHGAHLDRDREQRCPGEGNQPSRRAGGAPTSGDACCRRSRAGGALHGGEQRGGAGAGIRWSRDWQVRPPWTGSDSCRSQRDRSEHSGRHAYRARRLACVHCGLSHRPDRPQRRARRRRLREGLDRRHAPGAGPLLLRQRLRSMWLGASGERSSRSRHRRVSLLPRRSGSRSSASLSPPRSPTPRAGRSSPPRRPVPARWSRNRRRCGGWRRWSPAE